MLFRSTQQSSIATYMKAGTAFAHFANLLVASLFLLFAARFGGDLRVRHVQRIFLQSPTALGHRSGTESRTSWVSGSGLPSSSSSFFFFSDSSNDCWVWIGIIGFSWNFLSNPQVQSYRQIFNHDFLANVLLLQPQFEVGPRENVANAMSLGETFAVSHMFIDIALTKTPIK